MRREGSLGILRNAKTVSDVPEEYDVLFARYDYSGVLKRRRLSGCEALVSFLKRDVHLDDDALRNALEKVKSQGIVSVPNVIFTDDEIIHMGLAV